jgi:hypothetical protein
MTLELVKVATVPSKTLQPPSRAQCGFKFRTFCSRDLRLNVKPFGVYRYDAEGN